MEQTNKTASIKNKRYELRDDVEMCAKRVLEEQGFSIVPARIKYLAVYPNINKATAARCVVASNVVTFFGETDYIIEVSGEMWDALSDDLRRILMYHELLHVCPVQNEKTGEWRFSLREHDVMEFREIIKLHGIDWLDSVKTRFIESGGFEPDEIDTLSF